MDPIEPSNYRENEGGLLTTEYHSVCDDDGDTEAKETKGKLLDTNPEDDEHSICQSITTYTHDKKKSSLEAKFKNQEQIFLENEVEKMDDFAEENYDSEDALDQTSQGSCGCCPCCKSRKAESKKQKSRTRKTTKELTQKQTAKRLRRQNRKRGLIKCCKKFTAFLFSHIGLLSLVVAYSIMGGFIFRELEAPEEKIERSNVATRRKYQVDRLWNLTAELNILYPENWTREAEVVLKEFEKEIYVATKEKGWDGKDIDADLQWSFAGGLLYSITVITTIGYGHIAPKTNGGKFVTIVYALFGIPLTLLCLANLGSFLGDCFRLLYKHICLLTIWLCCPSQAKWYSEAKKNRNINPETIPINQENQEKKGSRDDMAVETGDAGLHNEVTVNMVDYKVKGSSSETVRVPIFVSLMLIALYIFGGAVLFSKWEGWEWLDGAYFCFITLSTIGFGDLVPGADTDSWSNQEKLITCAFYLMFGLAMIAMCFNLMQEEVTAKFSWLGRKIGIIDTKEKN